MELVELFATASDATIEIFIASGIGGATELGSLEIFFSVELATNTTILERLGKAAINLIRIGLATEIFGAAKESFLTEVGAGGAQRLLREPGESGVNLAGESAGHLEHIPAEEERDDANCHAEDDKSGGFGGGDNNPRNERAGAEEDGEGGVENEHGGESLFPAGVEIGGVGQENADEGEGGDHDKEIDEGLAGGDSDVGNQNRDDAGEENGDERKEERAEATREGDGDAGDGGAASDVTDNHGIVEIARGDS